MASSARRQSSSTSLSKYARAHSPDFADHSLDFCNAFWGLGDLGVDVLFARLRGATRTTEELKNFWKERASIEDQYAKRMAALARSTLGRDEIGEMRASLDTLRLETEKQSSFHLKLAQQIKEDLEGGSNIFLNRQMQHKRQLQTPIEREFKVKQQQEAHVQRAREKYESDCTKINSYTAQSTLIQGKELEKIQQKLRNVQQTVGGNERDFAQFARELQETTAKWEMRWKEFCDSCQDLEEERMEFMKDHMWGYANAISTVCVADDESCERLRLALESFEPDKDMEGFVRDYGTGGAIPDPPAFVNYTDPRAVPSSAQRPTTRPARFERASRRLRQPGGLPAEPPVDDNGPAESMTGVGAGKGRAAQEPQVSRSRSVSRASTRGGQGQGQAQGASALPPQGSGSGSINGTNGRSPEPVQTNGRPPAGANGNVKVGQDDDPLVRQLVDLQKSSGTVRRSSQVPSPQPAGSSGPSPAPGQQQTQRPTHQPRDSSTQLAPPPGSRGGGPPDRNPNYRLSGEIVVGAYPANLPASRPASPGVPMPVMAMPKSNSQPDNTMVQNVLADYGQSFPGERKSVSMSRPASRANSISGASIQQQQQQQQQQYRPPRPESMAGVGANGRSPSPQPFRPPSRAASPMQPLPPAQMQAPPPRQQPQQRPPSVSPTPAYQPPPAAVAAQQQQNRRASMRVPPPGAVATPMVAAMQTHQARQNSMSVPQQQGPARAASPNPVGIALDPSGRVVVDELRDQFLQRQMSVSSPAGYRAPILQGQVPGQQMQQPPQHQPPPMQPPPMQQQPPPIQQGPPPSMQPQMQPPQRQPSYPPPGQPQQPPYGAPPPQQAAPGYGAAPTYTQSPQAMQPPPQGYSQYQPYPQAQPDYGRVNGQGQQQLQRQQTAGGGYFPQQPSPQQQQPPPVQQQQPQQVRQQQPAPPPPQPYGQVAVPPPAGYTDDGRPILFYVKALYDYQAVIDEEFDFQSGDIIAVTATPEDGWWSGELLDEQRRIPGKHVFPSNFVDLLQ